MRGRGRMHMPLALCMAQCGCDGSVVAPGLGDAAGGGVSAPCPDGEPDAAYLPGTYFYLVDVEMPLAVQAQFFASTSYDATTGELRASFVNADRIDAGACDPACDVSRICSALQGCVLPHAAAVTTDAYAEYGVATASGGSFELFGCAYRTDGPATLLRHAPVDIVFDSPPVDFIAVNLDGELVDEDGVARGMGPFSATDLLIGGVSSGPVSGSHRSRWVAANESPEGLPPPP